MGWQNNWRWQYPSLRLWLRKPSRNLSLAREDPISGTKRHRRLLSLRYSPYILSVHP